MPHGHYESPYDSQGRLRNDPGSPDPGGSSWASKLAGHRESGFSTLERQGNERLSGDAIDAIMQASGDDDEKLRSMLQNAQRAVRSGEASNEQVIREANRIRSAGESAGTDPEDLKEWMATDFVRILMEQLVVT